MASIFGNLTTDGLEQAQDRLGGFKVFESDAYTGVIKAAYGGKSARSNAQSVTVILDTDQGEYRETFWVTDKDNKNYFLNKQDNSKKVPLPGFVMIDDLCLVTTDKPLSQQATEDKVMKIWDVDAKKELPKSVPMLIELLGKRVTFGVIKEIVNKRAQDASGNYTEIADSVEQNSTDKVFHYPSNMTVVEARQKMTAAVFFPAWLQKNKGNARDRRSIKDGNGGQGGKSGKPGAPPKAGETPPKTPSLFN
jgi:hypothetical protein